MKRMRALRPGTQRRKPQFARHSEQTINPAKYGECSIRFEVGLYVFEMGR